RKVGGLFAFENSAGVNAQLAVSIGDVSAVTHQTSRLSARIVDRGNHVARRQRLVQRLIGAVVVGTDPFFTLHRDRLLAKAASMSLSVLAVRTWICSPMAWAAASTSLDTVSASGLF